MRHEACVRIARTKGASGRCPICRVECADLTPIQQMIDRAAELDARGYPEQTCQLLREILDLDPCNIDAAGWLGCCYRDGQGVCMCAHAGACVCE